MMHFRRFSAVLPVVGLLACSGVVDDSSGRETEVGVLESELSESGIIVTRWVEQALDTVRAQNIGTPAAGRLYAMVTVAMFDAVNGIARAKGPGYEHALVAPVGAPKHACKTAAAATAAHDVLVALSPAQQPALDAALAADLAALGHSSPVVRGRAWGAHVAAAVLAQRADDGTQAAVIIPAGSAPGEHRADFDARFAHMTPFGIATAAAYPSPPPPALTSAEYTAAFDDVKVFGVQDGDPERNEISSFWLAEGGTVRETGTWLQAALVIVAERNTVRHIDSTARLFALLGMAIADGVLVSWQTKETYFTWRPTPAIREADTDGNPDTIADPTWTSRIGSPGGSPEYNSGTSTFAGAASIVIEKFYCKPSLDFCFETDGATEGPRCYDSPLEGALEAGRSRIYQGIHFQFSNEDGRRLGRALGDEVVTRRLRRVNPHGKVLPPICGR